MLSTRFTELVRCAAPVQSAPMGAVTGPELVAAVARAGGLGTLSAFALGPPEGLSDALDEVGAPDPGAVAVNILVPVLDPGALDVAASKARVVDFFWGDPDAGLVARVHELGALASWQVGSRDEAVAAADAGCDFVAAQGNEAGGHVRGELPVRELLDQVLVAVGIPVLASGGITDARAVADVLRAGADGVRVGTRFIAAQESGAHPQYIAAVLAADDDDSVSTNRFSVGCPLCPSTHRVLRVALEEADAFDGDVVGEAQMGPQTVPVPRFGGPPPARTTTGAITAMALYAGAGVGRVHSVQPAGEIVRELTEGAEALLGQA